MEHTMSETTFTDADIIIKTVFSRMRPSTMVTFILDMDDMSPEDYTDEDMRILHAAVTELCEVVGVSDAVAMLSAADVNASNPVIDAAFDEVTQ
jgi:hypothetical protein